MKNICCFAGHSKIYGTNELYDKLIIQIEKLITEENVSEFWVGNYGDFDKLCARVLQSLKEKHPGIQLNLVIPYLTADINENRKAYHDKYDNIIVADISEKTPQKLRILKCNEYMVQKSDYIICYVKNSFGGAYKTLEYANKKDHIKIFNLI